VLANGPIRVLFELAYDAWDADGTRVSETKRISLDAGHNFDRFESHYAIERGPRELTHAIGIKKVAGASFVVSPENASMRTWEPVEKQAGEMGCAVIVEPAVFAKSLEDKSNYLLTAKVPSANVAVYYAGFGWSRSGQFASLEDWDRYVSAYAQRLRAPVTITFTAK
jgi:pectinesterase